jgi:methylene-tetrahydromethanopterin dehydrogenase
MAKNILHMMTPLAHMSPSGVNMALDGGYDATAPYTNVFLGQITDLVQDAMFSRSPRDAVRTGVFTGGKAALLALDMLEAAGKALFKPFEISLFADPAGSFTTAAAMIAVVEKTLKEKEDRALRGAAFSVFGATGVVGTASAIIAALEGASVTLAGRDGTRRTADHAAQINRRFGVDLAVADGSTPEERAAILATTEVVLCTAKAGVRVLTPTRSLALDNCYSQPTSMRCPRPASKVWMHTPTVRFSGNTTRWESARLRLAMSNIDQNPGCSGR